MVDIIDATGFDNYNDESSVGMRPFAFPTYQNLFDMEDGTEVMIAWFDGNVEGYDVNPAFHDDTRKHMRNNGHQPVDPVPGMVLAVALPPDKQSDTLRAAIQAQRARKARHG